MSRVFSPSTLKEGRSGEKFDSRHDEGVVNYAKGEGPVQHVRAPPEALSSYRRPTSKESSAYVLWPPSGRQRRNADERAAYFSRLVKLREVDAEGKLPRGKQASTMVDLMTIRGFHSKALRLYSLGTALGFRTRDGILTNIPAIIVFVGRKVHPQWLLDVQILPTTLQEARPTST
ncbi:hypothetical protein Mp_6g20070 [Marchantia polymorpha subsp. ruderalis]|uniref:Nal1 N-terminal domain-containing protein n=2 Tax=Marchantia polymorpha TaxID=3197 RepID=A0AAF6BU16_MARPO|nr:hypothetical protein MARPO_0045s0057 [Marchantia polymorpha]BBN15500.1 hypothetical protein Mp_6g20070 [Marchantia polymorpha subsp. ruderalis]|eukprot:PTQ39389.1 hypothetical protein MARPO_0045s0057 [Marchantia polymorpha]